MNATFPKAWPLSGALLALVTTSLVSAADAPPPNPYALEQARAVAKAKDYSLAVVPLETLVERERSCARAGTTCVPQWKPATISSNFWPLRIWERTAPMCHTAFPLQPQVIGPPRLPGGTIS